MLRKLKSTISIVLALIMALSCFAVAGFTVLAKNGDTIYVKNSSGWADAYCYMWGNRGTNASWPGEKMDYIGDGIWSYKVENDYNNVIFGNGGIGGDNQTGDLTLPEDDKNMYDVQAKEWVVYNKEPIPTEPATTEPTTAEPTTAPAPDTKTVYANSNTGWAEVYCFMWNDGSANAEWPGVKMENLGNNIWSYTFDNNYKNIIFGNGGMGGDNQTDDLTLPEDDRNMYDVQAKQWVVYNAEPTTTEPTTTQPAPSSKIVYANNNAGWKDVYCFMWNDKSSNSRWPGVKMENLGDNIWAYTITGDYNNIIFGDGGTGGNHQTADLILPGNSYIYDINKGEWSLYTAEVPPYISADKPEGTQFSGTLELTITAENATSSSYIIDNGSAVEFTDKVSLTIGNDTEDEKTYTIKVTSANEFGTSEKTFTFKKVKPNSRPVENPAVPDYAENNCIYAHAEAESASTQDWQKWETKSGPESKNGMYYIFLPPVASNTEVELYNTYDKSIFVNGEEIKAKSASVLKYAEGEPMTVTMEGSSTKYLTIYKSDSEVSLFINDTTGSYTDASGKVYNDFYSFLVADKENAVSGSSCAIIDKNGVNDTTVKKFKGRGNSTWRDSDKKPFNINFNDKTNIGGISSKKFSLLANAKDGSLLRNRVMYDLADEVGSKYSPDSRTVDLYINGSYRGAYQITMKVELGKNSLVSLKDETDKLTENFNFMVEVDIWNYAGDVHFKSDNGIYVVCKSPDLEGYDGQDPTLNAQYNFIKSKYQQLEDALYDGDMAELEAICDVESLARAYLLQEFGKNCDGGMTSCYFTYIAADGKFIADPIWDCDSTLGNVNCERQNATNTAYSQGWAIKTAQYDRTQTTNILGQAFALKGKTSNNETFEKIVKRLWKNDFVPAIQVLMGNGEANGSRLKSLDEYRSIAPKSLSYNYIMWKHQWFPFYESLGGNYSRNLEGQLNYLNDWIVARESWMTSQLVEPEKDYYLTGEGFGGWGSKTNKLTRNDDDVYTIDVTFTKGTEYSFKIFDGATGYFTANVGDEETAKLIDINNSHNNATITPDKDIKATIIFNEESFVIRAKEEPVVVYGDANGDGEINVDDVTLIQMAIAEMRTIDEANFEAADVDHDGAITIIDATTIQKYIAEIISVIE